MRDDELVRRLREGDEAAFTALVEREHPRLVNLAMSYVPNRAVAEDVAQETWLAVLRGIDRFEGRSSLRTWIFSILVNRARSIGSSERRAVPVESIGDDVAGSSGGLVFNADGSWAEPPERWAERAEEIAEAGRLGEIARRAIDDLPASQRQVVTLRDVDGLSSQEVCDVLGISPGNQRVLLHRGRTAVRRALDAEIASTGSEG